MSIYFQNNTTLPIVLETWIKITEGSSKLMDVCILPYETKEINSLTEEWKIHRMFSDKEQHELWKPLDKLAPLYLGKFRNHEAYNGECVWLDTELFSLTKVDNLFIWVRI